MARFLHTVAFRVGVPAGKDGGDAGTVGGEWSLRGYCNY